MTESRAGRYFDNLTHEARHAILAQLRNARAFADTEAEAIAIVLTAQRSIHRVNAEIGRTDDMDGAALAAVEELADAHRQHRTPEWAR